MTAPIPDDLEDGIVGKGFPIEVYNVLGAGDAFMSGFLRGWLQRRAASRRRATWANACGAFAVSRLLCAPEYPTCDGAAVLPRERQHAPRAAQGRGAQPHPLGDDAPARQPVADGASPSTIASQLEEIADEPGAARADRAPSSGSR